MFRQSNNSAAFARQLLDFEPDANQAKLLSTKAQYVMVNCHRQWGKTTMTAMRAVHWAMSKPGQQIAVVSASLRQSMALANKCREFAHQLHLTLRVEAANQGSIVFPNGSVIRPLPAHRDRVRGFTAHFLIMDEAACISDEVYSAATPMLAATNGALWLLSTPQGPRGFFYDEWVAKQSSTTRDWLKISASAESSGRVTASFLNGERKRKTAEQFANEFECTFASPHRNVFEEEWLVRSFVGDIPVFDECSRVDLRYAKHRPMFYIGLDLGKYRDHAALVLLEYRVIVLGVECESGAYATGIGFLLENAVVKVFIGGDPAFRLRSRLEALQFVIFKNSGLGDGAPERGGIGLSNLRQTIENIVFIGGRNQPGAGDARQAAQGVDDAGASMARRVRRSDGVARVGIDAVSQLAGVGAPGRRLGGPRIFAGLDQAPRAVEALPTPAHGGGRFGGERLAIWV